ncbi:hypothetical protein GCM10010306_104020 [Streptomyces umbrinus]|nr:hypothetical protein GCM10010306_104020 [Streptomyces umbrinus]
MPRTKTSTAQPSRCCTEPHSGTTVKRRDARHGQQTHRQRHTRREERHSRTGPTTPARYQQPEAKHRHRLADQEEMQGRQHPSATRHTADPVSQRPGAHELSYSTQNPAAMDRSPCYSAKAARGARAPFAS